MRGVIFATLLVALPAMAAADDKAAVRAALQQSLDPTVQRDVSLNAQLNMAGYDTLGACIFAGFGYATTPDGVVKRLLKARYGWDDLPDNILQELGKQSIKMEREFNRRAGFRAKDDRIPEWMMKEPIPENGSVFDVSDEVLDHIYDGIE